MVTSSIAKNAKTQVIPSNTLKANAILVSEIKRAMSLIGLCLLLLCNLIVIIASIIMLTNSIAVIGATTLM